MHDQLVCFGFLGRGLERVHDIRQRKDGRVTLVLVCSLFSIQYNHEGPSGSGKTFACGVGGSLGRNMRMRVTGSSVALSNRFTNLMEGKE